jgi:hypothetical protein
MKTLDRVGRKLRPFYDAGGKQPPYDAQDAWLMVGSSAMVLVVATLSLAAAIGAAVGLLVAGLALYLKVRAWWKYLADLECPECHWPL